MEISKKKQLGAFYTDNSLVKFLVKKIINDNPNSILEPSFGDGIFIKNILEQNFDKPIFGIEIDKKTFHKVKNEKNLHLINKNFLQYEGKKFDAILGNPPFVRTRFLHNNQKKIAQNYYKKKLKLKSLSDPSIWALFLFHSMKLLNHKGSIGFVLPYDFTFVSYAKPLWNKLFDNFGTIEIHHTKKRYFPNTLQDTIVLYVSDFGNSTNYLNYYAYSSSIENNFQINEKIFQKDIISDNKIFKKALLPKKFFELEKKIEKNLIDVSEIAKFHIGYVSGNKKYFHPSEDIVKEFNLNKLNIIKTIADTKILKNNGIYTSNIEKKNLSNLFYPMKIHQSEKKYIDYGIKNNVNKQHKTTKRKDWYLVPLIKIPQLIVNVFEEFPIMIENDSKYIATNTFLCGYLKDEKRFNEHFILCNWFNSLTQLYFELETHSLGGGMLVLVPNEISKIKIPKVSFKKKNFLKSVDDFLKNKELSKTIELGDKIILKNELKLSDDDLDLIKKSLKILKFWRIPK